MSLGSGSGDTDAFSALFDDHYRLVLNYARRSTRDIHRAHDIAQETFVRAWQRSVPEEHARAWLLKTARNLIGDGIRRSEREREMMTALQDDHRVRTSPDTDVVEVRAALATLRPAEREVIYLTHWEGLSSAEIGIVLSISERAAAKRRTRAEHRLKSHLQDVRPSTVMTGVSSLALD